MPFDEASVRAMDPGAAIASLRRALPGIVARAATLDAAGSFPAEDIATLRGAGLLAAPLPPALGGAGLGSTEAGAPWLAIALRLMGRANLSVGRLYEGHVNALRLVLRHGTPAQTASAMEGALSGRLFAVWNTAAPGEPPLTLRRDAAGLRLEGRKILCSGAGHAERALVTALPEGEAAPRLVLVPLPQGVRADLHGWTAQGMRASVSGSVDFTGKAVSAEALIGGVGAYAQEPDFSAGAWRFAAVQAGGIEALADALRAHLRETGRGKDPHQEARVATVAAAAETTRLWTESAARRAEADAQPDPGATIAYVNLARGVVERAAMEAIAATQQAIGLAALLRPNDAERIARDLATYLRQPAPDRARAIAAAHVLAADRCVGDLWA